MRPGVKKKWVTYGARAGVKTLKGLISAKRGRKGPIYWPGRATVLCQGGYVHLTQAKSGNKKGGRKTTCRWATSPSVRTLFRIRLRKRVNLRKREKMKVLQTLENRG